MVVVMQEALEMRTTDRRLDVMVIERELGRLVNPGGEREVDRTPRLGHPGGHLSGHGVSDPPVERIAYSPGEVATMLGVSRRTVYNWMAAGKLRSVRVFGRRLIPAEEVQQLLGGETD